MINDEQSFKDALERLEIEHLAGKLVISLAKYLCIPPNELSRYDYSLKDLIEMYDCSILRTMKTNSKLH